MAKKFLFHLLSNVLSGIALALKIGQSFVPTSTNQAQVNSFAGSGLTNYLFFLDQKFYR